MFRLLVVFCTLSACVAPNLLWAEEPESRSLLDLKSAPNIIIDLALADRWLREGVQPTNRCSDETFVRRIHLDLLGRIPTIEERRRFLAATESSKRETLVDRLLASPEYARRMREVFDVALMGRAKSLGELKRRRENHWWQFLESSFAANRRWPEVVDTILRARSTDSEDRGATWFLFARENKHQDIAENVSRSIFGIQIQCAQCHDHPLAYEIEQRHYWGLVAFFNRGKNARTKRGPQLAESAVGGFSKFSDLGGESNVAKLVFFEPGGERRVEEGDVSADTKDADDLYRKAADNLPKEPKFSRRRAFAEVIARDNRLVSRALVNRVWALLMGRGLVHPVDEMDSEHPPSHPRLLEWLEHDFHQHGDVKRLVRAIVLSRAYQLEARGDSNPAFFARGLEKPLTAEDLYRSMRVALSQSSDGEDEALLFAFQQAFPDVFPVEVIANLKQSLLLSNRQQIFKLTEPAGENLPARMAKLGPDERIRAAFTAILGRSPESDELGAVREHWAKNPSAKRASQELAWALITSPEFRFNH